MGANVMVVFYSRYGEAEKLALAAGVGAIQARANIRLRRLADLAAPETIQADTAWTENVDRMAKDYIAPREIDAKWAEVVILAAPRGATVEMEQYLDSARELLAGKIAAVIGTFAEAARRAGLKVVPWSEPLEQSGECTAYGRVASERAGARGGAA